MQQLLASLIVSMGVNDTAYKTGMSNARSEAQKTGQVFDQTARQMTTAFQRAESDIGRAMHGIYVAMQDAAKKVRDTGVALTIGITVPLGLLAATSTSAAADFQTAMNGVKAAVAGASPKQLDDLRTAALQLGPAMGKSAAETAGAIVDLARSGMSAADILGGGLAATLKLATIGQTDLASAAGLATGVMQVFGKSVDDLPAILNAVSGTLDASRLGFADYARVVTGSAADTKSLGYTFSDLNAALAATAPSFTSSEQAASSFTALLGALAGRSDDAGKAAKQLGLQLYNADGSAKSLGVIADQLGAKLGDLNDKSKKLFLDKLFNADGAKAALALIDQGANGIAAAQAQMAQATGDRKVADMLDSEAAATQRLAGSWDGLKIAIGDAGLIQWATTTKNLFADLIDAVRDAPPLFMDLATSIGAVAGAIGPLTTVLVPLAKDILPFFLVSVAGLKTPLGLLSIGLSALVNPLGTVLRLLAGFAAAAVGETVLAALGTAAIALAVPLGAAAAAIGVVLWQTSKVTQASAEYRDAQEVANTATAKAKSLMDQLSTATGDARVETLKLIEAQKELARINLAKSRDQAVAARDDLVRQRQNYAQVTQSSGGPITDASGALARGFALTGAKKGLDLANLNIVTARQNLDQNQRTYDRLTAPPAARPPGRDEKPDDGKKVAQGDQGRDTSSDAADYAAKLATASNDELDAQADLTGSIQARYRATLGHLDAERAEYAHQLQSDQGITDQQADTLMASKDRTLAIRRTEAEQVLSDGLMQQDYDLAKGRNDTAQELARGDAELAQTASEKLAADLRLLALQRQQEESTLDLVIATKNSSATEVDNARRRKAQLDGIYGQRGQITRRQDAGPLDSFMATLPTDAAKMNEAFQNVAVDGLKGLTDGIAGAITGAKSLADVFRSVAMSIISDLAKIAVEKTIVGALGKTLGGLLGGGGGLANLSSLLNFSPAQSATSAILGAFGGGKATGGAVNPSNWYMVGEQGPEIFAPGTSGTIIPNGGLGAGRGQTVQQHFHVNAQGAILAKDIIQEINSMGIRAAAGGSAMAVSKIRDMNRRGMGTR